MFYKIYSALHLALENEKTKNFRYDFIIRTRPDITYNKKICFKDLDKIQDKAIALDYCRYGPNDQFWMGRREEMIRLASIWEQIVRLNNFVIFKNLPYRSHPLTAMYIAHQKMTTVHSPVQFDMSDSTEQYMHDLAEAMEHDFQGPAMKYKDNTMIKKFFETIQIPTLKDEKYEL
jgi:hypothetical protein